jgi:peptidoglycan/LPS O-acetylase OafA/YrhL
MNRGAAIPALTGLRFFAALAVVLCHYQSVGLIDVPTTLVPLFVICRDGVGLFFVLSGYVISYNYADWFVANSARRGEFFRARVARITPMHLLALVVMTPISLLLLPRQPEDPATLIGLSWILNALHLHAWLPVPWVNRWDIPSWSVSVEMFFYWLFPGFALRILNRLRTAGALWRLTAIIAGLGVVQIVGFAFGDPSQAWVTFFYPLARCWEFLIGCTLGALRLRHDQPSGIAVDRGILLVGMLLVAVAYVPWPEPWAEIHWYLAEMPLLATIVFLLGSGPSRIGRFLARPAIVLLGNASYSLYLLHAILIAIAVMPSQVLRVSGSWPIWLVLTVAASLVTCRYFETPMRRRLRGRSMSGLIPRTERFSATYSGYAPRLAPTPNEVRSPQGH